METVRITDVSPRDGLQNEPGVISTADKARLIALLAATGVDEIEITSFVSPRWVPQLGDAAELLALLAHAPLPSPRPVFSALVPNEQGMAGALAARSGGEGGAGAPLDKIAVFTAASETFSQKNINASIAQSIERFGPVLGRARAKNMPVRGYISCAVACPFEGPIAPAAVVAVAERLIELGCDEIDLGDTIGAATPEIISRLLREVRSALGGAWGGADHPPVRPLLTLHLHDTFGRAADCVRAALDLGVRSFDGSVAGLGGCPYAGTPQRPAPGNISTESLIDTIEGAGFRSQVDRAALAHAAAFAREIVAGARAGARP